MPKLRSGSTCGGAAVRPVHQAATAAGPLSGRRVVRVPLVRPDCWLQVQHPGRASALALLLRSAPWVEPALEAADLVLPMPLSNARLQSRGFNQALLLAQGLAPEKTTHRLLLRIKDTAPQSSLRRSERLDSLNDAFAVDPMQHRQVRGARLVLVDDVMTSGTSLFGAARVLRAAGAAHITGIVIARTE